MNRTDTTMQLIWLRSDLRLRDNTALSAAAARGPSVEKFDAEGAFIKHWLPQINAMNKKFLHNPTSLDGLFGAGDYPSMIVNLSTSRERALPAFKNLPSRQGLSPPE